MASKNQKVKAKDGMQPRASITFPRDLYQTLEDIAKQHKVSIAWVVRDAVEKYVAEKWPLFASNAGTSRE